MPIIPTVGRSPRKTAAIAAIYALLILGGVTMVYPFLITLTASVTNAYDYSRNSPVPGFLSSRADRFMHGLVAFFPKDFRGSFQQFKVLFPKSPEGWTTWQQAGSDKKSAEAFAAGYTKGWGDPKIRAQMERIAADYARFSYGYPLSDSFCSWDDRMLPGFFERHYGGSLDALRRKHGLPYGSFYSITSEMEKNAPMDQASSMPASDSRGLDFLALKDCYRQRTFAPGSVRKEWAVYAAHIGLGDAPYPVPNDAGPKLKEAWIRFIGRHCPVSETRPFPMKPAWIAYLQSETAQKLLGLRRLLDIQGYNQLTGTKYSSFTEIPFPLPEGSGAEMNRLWEFFVREQYPARNIKLEVSPEMQASFQSFLRERFHDLRAAADILGVEYAGWSGIRLSATAPPSRRDNPNLKGVPLELWLEFVQQRAPLSQMRLQSAESAYQEFLLLRYGSLERINRAYGWHIRNIREVEIPFDTAYTVYFMQNERSLSVNQIFGNYVFVLDYMFHRGRAVLNTLILVALTILATLTVNPLAAYALSRFQMRSTAKVIMFCLATSAFPAAVTVIPAYILMRDLHLLNTYAALVLPGLANGMAIFLLKGFFDSLPPELYEAATIDGAKEWQIFLRITMPLSKPILAVNTLFAFLGAYGGWEWALVTCQKEQMWTVSVWVYQFAQMWAGTPWTVMAMFVVASVPTLVVFLLCQNVILRGIVLPSMK